MKRKKTEVVPQNSEVCGAISEVKKRKKNKKKATVCVTDERTNDTSISHLQSSEALEDVKDVQKKKKKKNRKKENDAPVNTAESAEVTENTWTNVELNGKKKRPHKSEQPVLTENDGAEGDEEERKEEELSPEERRVLERKLKKIRKKEEKKKQKEEGQTKKEESESNIAQTQALEYLTCWSEKRDEWKFQKTRQVWLLQHMYDSKKMPDAQFSVLLFYLEGLRGMAREITVQKAEALVRFGADPEGEEGGVTEAQKRTQRAREVIQMLS